MEVPFKFKAFGWRLFLNRLSTNDLLMLSGMSFFLRHFFFGCSVMKKIMKEIANWVGKEESMEEVCLSNFTK